MRIYLLGYLVALLTFLAADMAWLGTMVPRFYKPIMGDIVAPDVNLWAAITFYALYPIGMVIFAVNPALKAGTLMTALIYGGLFGLFAYGTYNLTNHAVIRNWSLPLTVVDIAWGTFATALASAAAAWAATKIFGNT